jgi:hypothetical protein
MSAAAESRCRDGEKLILDEVLTKARHNMTLELK